MTSPGICVTTSRSASGRLCRVAERLASDLGANCLPRGGRSVSEIASETGAEVIVIVGAERISCYVIGGPQFFFHPSMAKNRIQMLRQGCRDPMVEAMGLAPGMSVLDATLGRAADACVAAHIVGEAGRVVGLEVVPLIANLTRLGLQEYQTDARALAEAMRRIEVVQADHAEYLACAESRSFDVVYFDPFFEETVQESQPMQPLRWLGRHGLPDTDTIEHAKRVARQRVVLKVRQDIQPPGWAQEWELVAGRKSRIGYRVWRRDGKEGVGERS